LRRKENIMGSIFGKSGKKSNNPSGNMGKNVALAVVMNPSGALIISGGAGDSINEDSVRKWINQDLQRYPELRSKVAAIEKIVILNDEKISSADYAQGMTNCYLRQMAVNSWAQPEGLHIFEMLLGPVTVYIAYGT
jgi:hypothetical protein